MALMHVNDGVAKPRLWLSATDNIAGRLLRVPAPHSDGRVLVPEHRGLTSGEAHPRLSRYSANEIFRPAPVRFWTIAREEMTEPMIVLLLVVGVAYGLWGGDLRRCDDLCHHRRARVRGGLQRVPRQARHRRVGADRGLPSPALSATKRRPHPLP